MSEESSNEATIFNTARQIETPEGRDEFLSEVCGDDSELRGRIEKLLAAYAEESQFLEQPAADLEATFLTDGDGRNLAASLNAGLAASFDQEEAVVVGNAGHSVLRVLGQTVDMPRVALRESQAEGDDPITRPKSAEMPERDSDSRYRLDGEIARGGMGAIIKGRDTDLGRDLAIKVLLDSHKDKPEVIQRFVEEAQIGGQLQHPGIAPIYELGQFADQRPFFAMKLVKGQTLSRLLADREDPTEDRGRLIGIFEQICQTMAYAHSRGVIHRDLKPANIMVGAFGEVQVMDWGLAKVIPAGGVADEKKAYNQQQGHSIIQTLRSGVGSDTPAAFGSVGSETQMGSVMGTPAYMPPEQALGEIDNMDERADVFGLGAILCEILTGQPPYVADDGTRVFRMASRGKLDDAFSRLADCGADEDLVTLTKGCLELEPADRPRDAGVLAQRVTTYLESVETKLREAEVQRAAEAARADESRQRVRVTIALAATVLLAVGGGGVGWRWMELQRIEHQAAVTSNVNDRLGGARLHRGLADGVDVSDEAGLQERIRELNVALESVREAVDLASADEMPPALRDASGKLLATLETDLTSARQAADRAAADRALVLELESIRASRTSVGEVASSEVAAAVGETDGLQFSAAIPVEEEVEQVSQSERYQTAFRNAGLDLATNSREVAAEWIRNSPIRETLIAALDDWSRVEVSGGNGIPSELQSISWSVLELRKLKSAAATLTPKPDGSILAGPASPEDDHYTIIVQPQPGVVSALRLEVLPDESIPNNGLGYHESGNPHLCEIRVFANSKDAPLPFTDAVASYAWAGRPISRAIDDNLVTEWHVWRQSRQPQQAIFLLESPVNVTAGQTLVIELYQKPDKPLGRFRLSCAAESSELRDWRKTSRKQLLALANAADHSEWRRQLRSALAANDVEKLIAMATDEEASSQSPAMLAWLGAGLRQTSAIKTSLKLLRDACDRYPSDIWLNYELGMTLARPGVAGVPKKEQAEGRSYLRTAVALSPRSLIPLVALRNSLKWWIHGDSTTTSAEDVAEFVAVVRQIHEIAPNDEGIDRDLEVADVYFRRKQEWVEVVGICRTRVELKPESARAHFRLGYSLYQQGKLDDATAAYRKATELDPKHYVAYGNIGSNLTRQGKWNEALAAYCNALDINPTYEFAHKRLGATLVLQDNLGEANAECQRVIALYDSLINDETDNATWLTNRALAHMAVQQTEPAQADWSRAIALDPNQLQRAFRAYRQAEQLPEAVTYGQQYIDANPDDALGWLEVATILVLAGEAEQYAAFCDRAVGQFADTTKPMDSERITKSTLLLPDAINLATLPTQPFVDLLENGTATEGQQPWFWATRALLAYRSGDAEAAIKYATRSEEHSPAEVTRALTLSVLALAQHQQGNTDKATTAFQEATQLLEKLQQNPPGSFLPDLQIAKILHREAEATINGKPSSTDEKADSPAETDNPPSEDPSEADLETANQENN